MTVVQGSDWFINWADFPAIAENNGNLLSHILQKSAAGTYSYDIQLNTLPKGSDVWQTKQALHTDQTSTEHGFVTMVPYGKEDFFVTWLDGRNTTPTELDMHGGAMTLRAAKVSAQGKVSEEAVLDVRTCDCCQTNAAITKNGPVVLYRDRSYEEVRDISIVREVNREWTIPKTIHNDHWKIKGCPVNGPKAAVMGNTLAVAWFTAAEQKPQVKLVFSEDGGEHFDDAITVSETQTIGRVDVVLLDKETVVVSFMETKDGIAQCKAIKISRSGSMSNPVVITEMDASRNSGFPQMELVEEKLFFAWTDVGKKGTSVKTAYINLSDL